jgi:hypothetical protein
MPVAALATAISVVELQAELVYAYVKPDGLQLQSLRSGVRSYAVRWKDEEIHPGSFWYIAPLVRCHECRSEIWLPYDDLPQTDGDRYCSGEDELEFPCDEIWSIAIACHRCALVDTYTVFDLWPEILPKQTEGRYGGATLLCARFPCGNRTCNLPVTVYGDSSIGSESDFVQFLRSVKAHGNLPCGHEIKTVPALFYRTHRVTSRLWDSEPPIAA